MVSNAVVVLYIAFLKNYKRTSETMEIYYTEPMSMRRKKLVFELVKMMKGTMSQKLIMAEFAMPILDKYNTIAKLIHDEEWEDIDFNDADILTVLNKAGIK